MFSRVVLISIILCLSSLLMGQATLPLTRTIWNAGAPTGWTDNGTGSYTSSFACTGNNMGQLNSTGDYYQVFFTGTPNQLIFKLKSASMNTSSFCLVEESANGTIWNTLGTYGPGNTPITDCADITIGLTPTTRYVRWTYTKSSGNCGIDEVSISAAVACTPVSEPTTNASNYSFSNIGCNGLTISWTSPIANDSSLVVMKWGSDVTTDPVDGTVYTANSNFGSGDDIGTSEFVVYNGSGTSVTVTGLNASTTYYINVFEYNGNSTCIDYRTSDEVSSSYGTVACDTCAYMTSALINSCDYAPCTEGDNEMLFFNSGNYYINTDASGITVNYGSTSPAPNTYADAFTTNSNAVDSMNADVGCSGVFIDASTINHIPPNSSFLVLNETICADAFDWSSICSAVSGNVYVLFSSDATWTSSGQFSNSPPASGRHFRTIFEGCTTDYFYDNNLPSGDGAIVYWDQSGGNATSYGTDGCSLPSTVLPIELISFTGMNLNNQNILKWSTASEVNNDYFSIEKSQDAFNFTKIGTVLGSGNSSSVLEYNFIDDDVNNSLNYYRLKQTDFNGEFSYSNVIAISGNRQDINAFESNNILHITINQTGLSNYPSLLNIYDIAGKSVLSEKLIESVKLNLSHLNSGVYIYQIVGTNINISDKIIIE